MAYKVIRMFDDLQDYLETKSGRAYHRYEVGDDYPRKGVSPSEDRIAELAGEDNAQGTPLIREVQAKAKAAHTAGTARKRAENKKASS